MVPILLVMLIYLGTWTISDTPYAVFVSLEIKLIYVLMLRYCHCPTIADKR